MIFTRIIKMFVNFQKWSWIKKMFIDVNRFSYLKKYLGIYKIMDFINIRNLKMFYNHWKMLVFWKIIVVWKRLCISKNILEFSKMYIIFNKCSWSLNLKIQRKRKEIKSDENPGKPQEHGSRCALHLCINPTLFRNEGHVDFTTAC